MNPDVIAEPIAAEPVPTAPTGPSRYSTTLLAALQPGNGKHVYGGTVAAAVVDRRRAANKAGRKSRRHQRHR